jgi:DNA-binding NarL/FixJ family response regulator
VTDLIDIVEASYDLEGSDAQWFRTILQRASPALDRGLGVFGFIFDVGRRDRSWMWGAHGVGAADGYQAWVAQFYEAMPVELRNSLFYGSPAFSSMSRTVTKGRPADEFPPLREGAIAHGFRDAIAVCARDPSGVGCLFGAPSPAMVRLDPGLSRRWHRLTAHIATGLRLRRVLSVRTALEQRTEAVLDTSGRVRHATGGARAKSARESLRLAVRAAEKARGPLRRREPETALQVWRALVAGRWSLVDRFESDGRRHVVAVRNPAGARDPRGLSEGEHTVARYVALGHSNKLIAYSLGLSEGTVAAFVSRALRKLGLSSRAALAHLFARPTAELDVMKLRSTRKGASSDAIEIAILSRPELEPLRELTVHQLHIVREVLEGASNSEIAKKLGGSPRTVANALARIYARLQVGSRAELARLF